MATTYTLIKGETLASAAASYTFTAIPSTYTDLKLVFSTRIDYATVDASLGLRPNGSSANDSSTWMIGNGSAASSSRSTIDYNAGRNSGASATANTFGSNEVYIPNYNSSSFKPMSIFGAAETNASAVEIRINALLWSNTAGITSFEINTDGLGNFVVGSSFYLYGIKNS
jgi:hypothetical protein